MAESNRWNNDQQGALVVASTAIAPTLERIRSFSALSLNWDSYGAHPLSPVAIATVDHILVQSLRLPIYEAGTVVDAVPSPDGGVLVEWESPSVRFQLRVHADGTMAGVRIDIANGVSMDWTDVPISVDGDVLDQLARLS